MGFCNISCMVNINKTLQYKYIIYLLYSTSVLQRKLQNVSIVNDNKVAINECTWHPETSALCKNRICIYIVLHGFAGCGK